MRAQFVPAEIILLTSQEVAAGFEQALINLLGHEVGDSTIALVCAHWALETGRGKKMYNYNAGNIKAGPDYEGYYTQFRCNEVINGKTIWFDPPHPQTNFRAYLTMAEGAKDYLDFLHGKKRFAAAWAELMAGRPAEFCHQLKLQNYYTASEGPYTAGVVSIFHEYMSVIGAMREGISPTLPAPVPGLPSADEQPEHSATSNADLIANLAATLNVDWDEIRQSRDEAVAPEV